MRKLRTFLARLGELFQRQRRDQEMAAEFESHLQMHIEDNLRAGMDPVEARRQALIKFGGMETTVEAYRERRGFSFGGTVLQDLRYSVRQLKKRPGFTAAVVLSLALGIGANTAIFSLIDAVMLKFLPVKNPEQLVLMSWTWRGQGVGPPIIRNLEGEGAPSFSYPTFEALRASSNLLSDTFAFTNTGKVNVNIDGQDGLIEGELASGDYFSGLGVLPAVGRLFRDSDDTPGAPAAAVISYGYWERRFGRDPGVVGKTATINRVPFTITGVSPPEFFGVQPGRSIDVWLPLRTQPLVEPRWNGDGGSIFLRRDDWWLTIMGRLQPGVSEQRALAQLGIAFRQSASDPDSITRLQGREQLKAGSDPSALLTLEFIPGGKGIQSLRDEFSKPLFIMMTVVGLVLLIACVNVANLLLARTTSRHKEMAVRLAVGAARRRLIRQLLTESLLLATIGGMFGLLLAYGATHLMVSLMSGGREPIILIVRPDLRVLLFTVAVCLCTGLLFGLAPALQGTRLDLTAALKENSRGSANKRHARIELGKVLVVSQVAMSLLLLAGAGLFVRTLGKLESINAGFDRRNILLFGIDPTQNGYKGEKVAEFYQELQRRIAVLPGVRSATLSRHSLIGDGDRRNGISIQGYTPLLGESRNGALSVNVDQVGPHFFETMGIPLLLGRSIEGGDDTRTRTVAVINEKLARKYFGNSSPIGRRFGLMDEEIEIIGVVADTKYNNLRNDVPPTVYLAAFQDSNLGFIRFEIRTAGDPRDIVSAVRHAVLSLDKNLPISDVKTQVEQIDQTLFQERLFAKLSSFFGLLALILACIGLYGIMSYSVARRTNEIGLRMALGATQEDILRKVLWQALGLVFLGVGIGIPLALAVLRLISSMLFGLKATDPATLAAAIAFMVAVAAVAGYLPAKRASQVDPMVALCYE